MPTIHCDVAIIGAGTAGLAAERHARQAGAQTVLIDPMFRGTTCAAVGCMPSKLLIAAATTAHQARTAGELGIAAPPTIDGQAVMARVHRLRDHFVSGVKDSYDKVPVKVQARARFTSATTLALDNGDVVEARSIVIATGASSPVPEAYAGLGDLVLTNETVFDLTDLPRRLAVIGAGSLGLELAQAFARLGVEVTVLDSGASVNGLNGEEAERMARILRRELALHQNVKASARREGDEAVLDWDGGTVRVDRVLVAAGRPPALDGLDLEATGLELDDHGVPVFDPETLQCGSSSVFIAGDANHYRPVLHEATAEGTIAGSNAAGFPDIRSAKRKVPMTVAFTHPGVAMVGQVPKGVKTVTGHTDYDDQGRARVEARNDGFVRLEADADGRILQAVLCMPDAEHVAHWFALAIGRGMTAAELLDEPIYHPTVEEGLRKALSQICSECGSDVPWDRRSGPQPGDV